MEIIGKVMSLFSDVLPRLVITFLPRSKHLLVSWLQSPSAVIFEPPQNKISHCFHCFPIYLPWSDGTRCHDLRFLNVEFSANFFTLLFYFHQEAFQFLFTLCHKCGIICMSELVDISPGNLDSSLCFIQPSISLIYSAYKLNKQGNNMQPWRTPFQFGTSLLFYVQFSLLLLDLHTDFSKGRSCGLVFPSLEEFSTVCGDPHSQRLWPSQ